MNKFAVMEIVNPHAPDVQYGRGCNAAPRLVGYVYAKSWEEAMKVAEDAGYGYYLEYGLCNYLLHSVVQVPTCLDPI